jgi:hypothetical protein
MVMVAAEAILLVPVAKTARTPTRNVLTFCLPSCWGMGRLRGLLGLEAACSAAVSSKLEAAYPESLLPFGSGTGAGGEANLATTL